MVASRLAKLTRPRTDGLLRRDRLCVHLDQCRERPVIWLSAPPGAGKTSLVASWLEDRRLPHLWYQVDANDADPATFLHYLREATDGLRGTKAKPLPPFRAEHLVDLGAFSRLFFRGLFARIGSGVLVLDNIQEVQDSAPLQTVLEAGFDEIPEGVNVVALSRGAPSAAMARLRAGQRISLIEWEPLKLTLDEAARIASSPAEPLPDQTLRDLFDQTHGWAAGLVLMLERLRQTGQLKRVADPENLETVFDYFAGQVFGAAPAAHRDMLTRMSYLPRMTAELAQAITGDAEAGTLLNHLARRNLFTDRRAGEDTSYQFHALFRVFLQERARNDFGFDEHRRLTNSAAALLQTTGQVEDAFALYAEAAEWEPATRLILKEADRLVRQGRRQTLRQWIQSLPMDRFDHEPWLAYWYAVSHFGADYRVAVEHLERAYTGFEANDDWKGMTLAACRAVDMRFAATPPGMDEERWYGRLEQRLAQPRTDAADQPVYGEALVKLLQALIGTRPFTREFSAVASRVEAFLELCDDDDLRLTAVSRLMVHWIHQGDRQRVQHLYRLGAEMIDTGKVTNAAALWWYQPAVLHHLCIGDVDTARRLSEAAKVLVDDSGCVPDILEFDRLLSVTLAVTDGVQAGDRYLRETVVPHLHMATGFTRVYTYLLLASFALALDQPGVALAASLDGLAIARPRGERSLSMRYLTVVHAAALSANSRYEEAWGTLDALIEGTDDGYNAEVIAWRRQVEIDLLLRQGHRDEAHTRIREHIAALSSGRYERTTAHSSKIYARIYAEALDAAIEPDFAKRMIRTFRYLPPASAGPDWPWPVRIRALGGLALDGESVVRKSSGRAASRVLDLLKAIVALGGTDVPCTALADTVWPESDGAAAMRAFDVTLFRLRKLLGREDAILVRAGRLSLNPGCCWLDSRAFDQSAEGTDRLAHADASLDGELARGNALYRGHLLAGEDEHPVLLAARDKLRSRWLALVRRQAARCFSRSDWGAMVRICRDALALDPTPEDLLRLLMEGLDRQGQRSEALNVYRLGAEQLRLSVGSRPAAETEALARTLEQR